MEKNVTTKQMILDIARRISESYGPEKIILFGSYAYGTPTRDSDIDLFIVKRTSKKRAERFCEVRKLVRDIRGVSIQPMVFTPQEVMRRIELDDDFIKDILARGEKLYG